MTPPWPSTGPGRRRKMPPPTIGRTGWRPYKAQDGRCPLCGDWLLPAEDPPPTPREWERWLATNRKTIIKTAMRTDGTSGEPRLLHTHCHHRHTAGDDNVPALLSAREPLGLA
jgi:RNA-directed DNA polymerase